MERHAEHPFYAHFPRARPESQRFYAVILFDVKKKLTRKREMASQYSMRLATSEAATQNEEEGGWHEQLPPESQSLRALRSLLV